MGLTHTEVNFIAASNILRTVANYLQYSIEFVWIVKIREDSQIGISVVYNAKKRRVEIKGIHSDKQLILNQHHAIISPLDSDYFVTDFEFETRIDHLSISQIERILKSTMR